MKDGLLELLETKDEALIDQVHISLKKFVEKRIIERRLTSSNQAKRDAGYVSLYILGNPAKMMEMRDSLGNLNPETCDSGDRMASF